MKKITPMVVATTLSLGLAMSAFAVTVNHEATYRTLSGDSMYFSTALSGPSATTNRFGNVVHLTAPMVVKALELTDYSLCQVGYCDNLVNSTSYYGGYDNAIIATGIENKIPNGDGIDSDRLALLASGLPNRAGDTKADIRPLPS